ASCTRRHRTCRLEGSWLRHRRHRTAVRARSEARAATYEPPTSPPHDVGAGVALHDRVNLGAHHAGDVHASARAQPVRLHGPVLAAHGSYSASCSSSGQSSDPSPGSVSVSTASRTYSALALRNARSSTSIGTLTVPASFMRSPLRTVLSYFAVPSEDRRHLGI